ncbi:hypothetical protein HYS94_01945 [Candidatus Daviesbacteria bacterium]|nr:hypothetical protein [Candidatus Daviesbacteria bacterium]
MFKDENTSFGSTMIKIESVKALIKEIHDEIALSIYSEADNIKYMKDRLRIVSAFANGAVEMLEKEYK